MDAGDTLHIWISWWKHTPYTTIVFFSFIFRLHTDRATHIHSYRLRIVWIICIRLNVNFRNVLSHQIHDQNEMCDKNLVFLQFVHRCACACACPCVYLHKCKKKLQPHMHGIRGLFKQSHMISFQTLHQCMLRSWCSIFLLLLFGLGFGSVSLFLSLLVVFLDYCHFHTKIRQRATDVFAVLVKVVLFLLLYDIAHTHISQIHRSIKKKSFRKLPLWVYFYFLHNMRP